LPEDPGTGGLGASLRESESFADDQPPADGGRWAGLTDPVHPVPRPITEFQYEGQPPARPVERPGPLSHRNTREPWTPPPPRTPTHRD
jgi:hypothetical protein